jgi:hypothetical protein
MGSNERNTSDAGIMHNVTIHISLPVIHSGHVMVRGTCGNKPDLSQTDHGRSFFYLIGEYRIKLLKRAFHRGLTFNFLGEFYKGSGV